MRSARRRRLLQVKSTTVVATEALARAYAAWKQSFRIGGGAIASSTAKRRAQQLAMQATIAALEVSPETSDGMIRFLSQLLRDGTILRGGEVTALLDRLVRAPWAPPAMLIALAGALRSYDETLSARAAQRALMLSPGDEHDAVLSRIDAMAQPVDLLPDATLSDRPVTAWRCKMAPTRAPTRDAVSKLGGTPWLPASQSWPCCGACGQHMLFAAQLARSEALPLRRHHLVSFFFCDTCLPAAPDGTSKVSLWSTSTEATADPPPRSAMREYRIEVKPFKDKPDEEKASAASFSSKLGGFPRWVQDDETPICPHCGARMVCVAQIEPSIDAMLIPGDCARWFVCVCPTECTSESATAVWQSA
jgi:hypothetical protein